MFFFGGKKNTETRDNARYPRVLYIQRQVTMPLAHSVESAPYQAECFFPNGDVSINTGPIKNAIANATA